METYVTKVFIEKGENSSSQSRIESMIPDVADYIYSLLGSDLYEAPVIRSVGSYNTVAFIVPKISSLPLETRRCITIRYLIDTAPRLMVGYGNAHLNLVTDGIRIPSYTVGEKRHINFVHRKLKNGFVCKAGNYAAIGFVTEQGHIFNIWNGNSDKGPIQFFHESMVLPSGFGAGLSSSNCVRLSTPAENNTAFISNLPYKNIVFEDICVYQSTPKVNDERIVNFGGEYYYTVHSPTSTYGSFCIKL